MKQPLLRRLLLLSFVGNVLWLAPLVRIVPSKAGALAESGRFDAQAFAERFWMETLPAALDTAPAADEVLPALRIDPEAVKAEHGHSVGYSSAYYLLFAGEGELSELTPDGYVFETRGAERVVLQLGPVFGSTVRDATGLLDHSSVPTSRDFNAVSEALNRVVEQRVIANLMSMKPGAAARVVGCLKVSGRRGKAVDNLVAIPLQVEAL